MQPLTTPKLIIRRLADDWKLLLSVFIGITIAASLIAGAPVYIKTLERQSLNTAIDRSSGQFLNIYAYAPHISLGIDGLDSSDQTLNDSVLRNISEIYRGRQRYLSTPNYLVGRPGQPLADSYQGRASRGFFQHISNLADHVTFLDGRMAGDSVVPGPRGPALEAVLSVPTSRTFGLSVGDTLILTPSLGQQTRINVHIVGIMEPNDPTEEYWQYNANIFIDPQPLDEISDDGVEVDPEEPPVVVFITERAMVEGIGSAYPGTLVRSTWFIYVDKETLKEWSISETRSRLDALVSDINVAMEGSAVFTGISGLLRSFETRSFFSSVPLLLLLVIMVITVLYYLAMMVSYLVQSRENDVALLRSRGVSVMRFLQLYALEGLVLTGIAAVLSPFVAIGAVAVAGKLPYFQDITGGGMLPVELHWSSFVAAAGAGLLSLTIFVVPGVVGARAGLVIHKLRSSRPPSVPFFQRYYLDIALVVLGGLVFWELHERGNLVSGGLFTDVRINEALLLAPVLLLTLVALLFMRFFPLFVRFISGESPTLIHLVAAASLVTLGPAIIVRDVRDGESFAWVFPVVLLGALGGAYLATHRARKRWTRYLGLAAQAVLVAAVLVIEPRTDDALSLASTISLASIVPAQAMFFALAALSRIFPVWVSMGIWHMARNPLQYSWLVLLLVMVTGLGVLATTVGGTLDRSYEERILYEVAADLRVSGVPGYLARDKNAFKELYLTVPGVTEVSLALRGSGVVGTTFAGNRIQVLAVESQEFPYISWYRDDFSDNSLGVVMKGLQANGRVEPVNIPEGATSIGLWAKPGDTYANIVVWLVIEDARGIVDSVTLGPIEQSEWHLMQNDMPRGLEPPLQLVAVQLYQPVFGPAGTPGTLLLDDIHVTAGFDGGQHVLEDFEGKINWTALATSKISSDVIAATREDVYRGRRSGLFVFGKDTDNGIRGFYQSSNGGAMPMVASSNFLAGTGSDVGDTLVVNVMGRLVPILITDTVDYFPTMSPFGSGFLLADLDNLMRHLNILTPISIVSPNELFISQAPGAGQSVRDSVIRLTRSANSVRDREALLEAVRLDPLLTAGWKAMVLLSMAIILFTAGLGYVTYLLSFADRSQAEMASLRSLGLSQRQIMWLLSLEHLVIVIIGLALGTWAGFQMSTLLVSSVAVTETGHAVVPPFILTTNWGFMLPLYAAMLTIFVTAVYRLTRGVSRQDLHSVSRMEV